jgi:hypothetical protein
MTRVLYYNDQTAKDLLLFSARGGTYQVPGTMLLLVVSL